ncbi:HIT family protein [Candidatus Woesearchaeota archaeon]|jgi:histidine triad (HIT) family protein|nr:HIT family protein [Candidatus Woesearchaeota archaeon]MBT6518382.1 HIT family protein [Candidatus Woesearchaeota archaeon]MBT7366838.1 HIT family protein [Candidatus Woesearchaeota archaeon]
MTSCPYCDLIQNEQFPLLYEDEIAVAFLTPTPHVAGHTIVCTKKHISILEQLPDDIAGHLFDLANRLSSIIHTALNTDGTNILVNNGPTANQDVPHFSINILPRRKNDGYKFDWNKRELNNELMLEIHNRIKTQLDKNIKNRKEEKEENIIIANQNKDQDKKQNKDDEENYLLKQLQRVP